jgi:hypothetical protein
VTGEEKEDEQAPDSHIAEPTPALPRGQALARGVLLDYDLFLGSRAAFLDARLALFNLQPLQRAPAHVGRRAHTRLSLGDA